MSIQRVINAAAELHGGIRGRRGEYEGSQHLLTSWLPALKCLNGQAGHATEFIVVVGYQSMTIGSRRGGDPQIVGADEPASAGQQPVDFSVLPRNLDCPWQDRVWAAELFPLLAKAGGSAAGKFTSDRERDIQSLLRVLSKVCMGSSRYAAAHLALCGDDEVGIENQAQGFSGGKSWLIASSMRSRSLSSTPAPPARRYASRVAPVSGASGSEARRTTCENDSPGFFAVRNFSYASSSSVMVFVAMHE